MTQQFHSVKRIRTWVWDLVSRNNSGREREISQVNVASRLPWAIENTDADLYSLSLTGLMYSCSLCHSVWLRGNNSTKWEKICLIVWVILFCLRTFPLWLVGLLFLMSFKSCENQPTLITANLWQQSASHPDAEVAGGDAVGFKSPPM